MTVKITKPEINVREKLNELKKPTGVAGEAMLRAETPQEQQALVGVGRKNLIFNGAMNIAQRETTFDKNSFTGSKYYSLDRFHIQSSTPSHDHTVTQSTDAPDGFSHSFKYTQDTAASSYPATSSQYHRLRHHLEGQNCKQIENADCVLTFYVKSSIAGKYDAVIFALDSSLNHMVLPYTINHANTWEKKELRFIGPSTISRGANVSLDVQWHLARSGSNYHTTTPGVWGATKLSSPNSTDALIKTAGATWQITGVQLELGKVATPFEHRSYGEELALCQRYYTEVKQFVFNANKGTDSHWDGHSNAGSYPFPVTMRASPSVTIVQTFGWIANTNSWTAPSAGRHPVGIGVRNEQNVNFSAVNYWDVSGTSGSSAGSTTAVRIEKATVDAEL